MLWPLIKTTSGRGFVRNNKEYDSYEDPQHFMKKKEESYQKLGIRSNIPKVLIEVLNYLLMIGTKLEYIRSISSISTTISSLSTRDKNR